MSCYSMTCPGITRAWHKHHRGQIDHVVRPKGRITVTVYDDREDSPTQGERDTFVIGDEPAFPINVPTNRYDDEDSDEERLPHDTDTIPLDWDEHPSR